VILLVVKTRMTVVNDDCGGDINKDFLIFVGSVVQMF
jgi:hypothetical protein